MEANISTSSNSSRENSPSSPYRPSKRRRLDGALDQPTLVVDRVQLIPEDGFATIHGADVRRPEYYLSKVKLFVEKMKAGFQPRWEDHHVLYTHVYSLLLRREGDERNAKEEVRDLCNVLKDTYQYESKIWDIASSRSCFAALTQESQLFRDDEWQRRKATHLILRWSRV